MFVNENKKMLLCGKLILEIMKILIVEGANHRADVAEALLRAAVIPNSEFIDIEKLNAEILEIAKTSVYSVEQIKDAIIGVCTKFEKTNSEPFILATINTETPKIIDKKPKYKSWQTPWKYHK